MCLFCVFFYHLTTCIFSAIETSILCRYRIHLDKFELMRVCILITHKLHAQRMKQNRIQNNRKIETHREIESKYTRATRKYAHVYKNVTSLALRKTCAGYHISISRSENENSPLFIQKIIEYINISAIVIELMSFISI